MATINDYRSADLMVRFQSASGNPLTDSERARAQKGLDYVDSVRPKFAMAGGAIGAAAAGTVGSVACMLLEQCSPELFIVVSTVGAVLGALGGKFLADDMSNRISSKLTPPPAPTKMPLPQRLPQQSVAVDLAAVDTTALIEDRNVYNDDARSTYSEVELFKPCDPRLAQTNESINARVLDWLTKSSSDRSLGQEGDTSELNYFGSPNIEKKNL